MDDTKEKNAELELMLKELRAYIDQLNMALKNGCRDEMNKSKEQYKEVLILAGELDDKLIK